MALVTRSQILSAALPTVDVTVDEWGGDVRVKALSIKERADLLDDWLASGRAQDEYEADQAKPEADRAGVAKPVALDEILLQLIYSIVDDAGAPLFSVADHEALRALSYPTIQKIWAAFRSLNVVKTEQTVEDVKKSSD